MMEHLKSREMVHEIERFEEKSIKRCAEPLTITMR